MPQVPGSLTRALLIASALLAACGDDDSSTPATGETTGTSSTTTTTTTTGAGGASTTTGSTGGSTGTGGGGAGTGGSGGAPCLDPVATADHPAETEPNDASASANALPAGKLGFVANVCPTGDVDVFSVDVPAGGSIEVAVSDGMGGCPAGSLPDVSVLDASDTFLAEDTGFGCTALDAKTFPALGGLPAGTYFVRVTNAEPAPLVAYVVDIAAVPPGCGDGVVQPAGGEQCDDGELLGGDGCSPSCQLEGNFVDEVEINDTQATATPLGGADGAFGAIGPAGDVDWYTVDVVQAGSSIRAVVSDGLGGCPPGFDSLLVLYDPFGSSIASDDESGAASCSLIDPVAQPGAKGLPSGTYALAVSQASGAVAQPWYVLEVVVHPPGCGDAVLGAGEQCDDGNETDGDGCSASCQAEPPWEIEPNDTQFQATPQWPANDLWKASLSPLGEQDWFSFVVPQGANVTLSTNDLGNVAGCTYDTVIHLVDSLGTELTSNDDGGVNSCSKLDPASNPEVANMAAGTYYVRVHEIFDSSVIPGYELHIEVQ